MGRFPSWQRKEGVSQGQHQMGNGQVFRWIPPLRRSHGSDPESVYLLASDSTIYLLKGASVLGYADSLSQCLRPLSPLESQELEFQGLIVLQQRGCEGPAESPRLRVCRLHLPSPSRCLPRAQTPHGRQTPRAGHTGQDSGSLPTQSAAPVKQIGQELCQE